MGGMCGFETLLKHTTEYIEIPTQLRQYLKAYGMHLLNYVTKIKCRNVLHLQLHLNLCIENSSRNWRLYISKLFNKQSEYRLQSLNFPCRTTHITTTVMPFNPTLLFTRLLNSPEAYYKVSTSERNKQNKHIHTRERKNKALCII
jgi:hypothetical protein